MASHTSGADNSSSIRLVYYCLISAVYTSVISNCFGQQFNLSSPLEYQVCQRTSAHQGKIRVEGKFNPAPEAAGSVEARLIATGAIGRWEKLVDIQPGAHGFEGELLAPAGGWYRLEFRAKVQGLVTGQASVGHVGVGEVFVIAGQSNSANHGSEKQQTRTGLVATFSGTNWTLANDPQPGASGSGGSFMPPFGDAMAERFGVPIGMIAAGVGATSVREWLPTGTGFPNPPTLTNRVAALPTGEWESDGRLFQMLVTRMRQLGPHGFRAVLWHQGESDAHQQDPSRTLSGELYERYLAQLIRDCRRAVGWEMPWFVAQASYHTPDDPGSPEIRAAQEAVCRSGLALEGPDTDALQSGFRDSGGKGVHFSGTGLREHARVWVDKVAPWLEAQFPH